MFDRLKQQLVQRLDLPRIAGRADAAADAVPHLDAAIHDIEGYLNTHSLQIGQLRTELDRVQTWVRLERTMAWAATAPLLSLPPISVVMPTRNRESRLACALASVIDQTYPNWQLVIVDDGSTDATPALLESAAADDHRITLVRTEGVGAAAARNVGIEAATGDWVAFLDDDNVMNPGWLRAVVEYAGRTPDCTAVFGAQLRDDVQGGDTVPWLLFDEHPSIDRLRLDNTIDLGALAMRRDHPELRFDEELTLYIDWELVVRVFEVAPIQPLPVLASTYTSRAATRITDQHGDETLAAMRRRLAP